MVGKGFSFYGQVLRRVGIKETDRNDRYNQNCGEKNDGDGKNAIEVREFTEN